MAALPPHVGGMVESGDFWDFSRMRHVVFSVVLAAFAMTLAAAPARAADPVFPPNSRVGLAPPPGFVTSTKFPGFENSEAKAAIVVVELPAEAFPEVEKGFSDETLKARGVTVESREEIPLATGRGILVIGQQTVANQKRREMVFAANLTSVAAIISFQVPDESRGAISDATVRDALKTAVARASVPDAEKLSVLPYKIRELAGFRVVRGAGDGSALLTDGPEDIVAAVAQPFVLIGITPGEAPKPEDRDTFARRAFSSLPGIKEVKIVRAEPLRINNLQGFEILAEAKDASSNTDITAVQWLRFGPGGYLTMFAIARRDVWAGLFPRLRAIRDGIDLR
jgi:hypothetical protein